MRRNLDFGMYCLYVEWSLCLIFINLLSQCCMKRILSFLFSRMNFLQCWQNFVIYWCCNVRFSAHSRNMPFTSQLGSTKDVIVTVLLLFASRNSSKICKNEFIRLWFSEHKTLLYRARYNSNGFLHFPQNKDNNEALFSQNNIVIINIYFPKWTRKWNP